MYYPASIENRKNDFKTWATELQGLLESSLQPEVKDRLETILKLVNSGIESNIQRRITAEEYQVLKNHTCFSAYSSNPNNEAANEATYLFLINLERLTVNSKTLQKHNTEIKKLRDLAETKQALETAIESLLEQKVEAESALDSVKAAVKIAETTIATQETSFNSFMEKCQADTEALQELLEEYPSVKAQLKETYEKSSAKLTTEQTKAAAFNKELEALKEKAKNELGNALNTATFKEFVALKEEKIKKADFWGWLVLGLSALILIVNVVWLLCGGLDQLATFQAALQKGDLLAVALHPALLQKLFVNIPLVAFTVLCTQRWLRELRLAEEYSFKSACALHFTSYMELVKKVATEGHDVGYRDFLIGQINTLFTSPLDKVYKNSNAKFGDLHQLSHLLGVVSPPLEKLVTLVKQLEKPPS
jgi:hypothetical protein